MTIFENLVVWFTISSSNLYEQINSHWNESTRNDISPSFEKSLKNARDDFDSNVEGSGRTGWKKGDTAKPLSKISQVIFDEFNDKTELEVWESISKYCDTESKKYRNSFEEIIAIQQSEKDEYKNLTEGGKKIVTSYKYERKAKLRDAAIRIHGVVCQVCGFDFEEVYGEWGEGYIEVHHLKLLAD